MATLDILTAAEAQTAAINAATGHEDRVAQMNTAVSKRVDELVGPVVQRPVTEYHDGGCPAIRPRLSPVASVTTLKEWSGSTLTTLTEDTWGTAGNATGFLLEQSDTYAHACKIVRRSGGAVTNFQSGHRSLELVYVAGRAADTASVDPRFKQVVASILGAMWKREAPVWAQSSELLANLEAGAVSSGFYNAVDRRVQELLADEMFPALFA